MKTFVTAFAVFFGVNLFATTAVNANLFVCNGPGNTDVSFTSSSFTGSPTMQATFQGSRAQGKVSVSQSAIGTLATITDTHMVPVDGPTVRYTLVVPHTLLNKVGDTEKFETLLIRTNVANPFFRPAPSARLVENNTAVSVECTAQSVLF
jgi:hypothetical protein